MVIALPSGDFIHDAKLLHAGREHLLVSARGDEFLVPKVSVLYYRFPADDDQGIEAVWSKIEKHPIPKRIKANPQISHLVEDLKEIYSQASEDLPEGNIYSIAGVFLKEAGGSPEIVVKAVSTLAEKGVLGRSVPYILGTIKGLKADLINQAVEEDLQEKSTNPTDERLDGIILPNGDVWSARLGRRVSKEEFAQI